MNPVTLGDQHLLPRLCEILGLGESEITNVTREANEYFSTSRSEVVSCETAAGERLSLFLKYFAGDVLKDHTGPLDPAYEIRVYRELLGGAPGRTPRMRGAWYDEATGQHILVLDSLGEALRVSSTSDPNRGMVQAARWLGEFHAHGEQVLQGGGADFLRRLDAAYFEGRLAQFRRVNRELLSEHLWLVRLIQDFGPVVARMLSGEQTTVHGEYYSANILIRGGDVYPVDWETAAVTAGEWDLAMLVDGWPVPVSELCRSAYHVARYDCEPPAEFERRLAAAQVLLNLHHLGWDIERGMKWRLKALHRFGAELGLV